MIGARSLRRLTAANTLAVGLLASCSGSNVTDLPQVSSPPVGPRLESMPAFQHLKSKYETINIKLSPKGGMFMMKPYGGFTLSGAYNANNAAPHTTLTITNSGTKNRLGAPTPSYGTPVLFIEASVKPGGVAFKSGYNTITIESSSLQTGAYYDLVVYARGQLVESYSSAYAADNGILTLQTPFSSLSIAAGKPITIELVAPSPESVLVPCSISSTCNGGAINYYNGNVPGGITSSFAVSYPSSVAVDDANNIYVGGDSNTECQSYVLEFYAAGGSFEYTNNLECGSAPWSIAATSGASPAFAVLGISNYEELVFPEQGVNSSGGYNDPNLAAALAVTVDGADDVFLAGRNMANNPEVDILTPSQGLSNLGLQLSGLPTALAIDTQGDLLVAECGHGINVFPPGKTSPTAVYDAQNCPSSIVFGNGGNWLYAPTCCLNGYVLLYVYQYPGPGTTTEWYDALPYNDTPSQIAVEPRVPLFNPDIYRKTHSAWKYWTDLKKRSQMKTTGSRLQRSLFLGLSP